MINYFAKNRILKFLICFFSLFQAQNAFTQNNFIEKYELYFGTMAPLMKLESAELNGKFYFYANNTSLYPLWIKVECKLTNMIFSKMLPFEEFVFPGKSTLFFLEPQDKNQTYSYDFKYSSRIGNPYNKYNDKIIYLIPLKPGKKTSIFKDKLYQNCFTFSTTSGDSIYASRKGFICGTPKLDDGKGGRSQYSISNNLEIMHNDGSFGIYSNLNPEKIFVQSGQNVNTGDLIGIAMSEYINFYIFKLNGQSKIEYIPIIFYINEDGYSVLTPDKEYLVNHPDAVIEQEMTKKQIKKRKKQ
jgi:hypothetical protein